MAPFVPDPSTWYTVTAGLNNGLQMGCGDPTNGSASVFLGSNANTLYGKWQFLPTNGTDAGLIIRVQRYGLYGDPHCMNIDYQQDSPGGAAYTPVMSACNNHSLPNANGWNIQNDTFGTTYFWHNALGQNYRMFHLPQTGQMNFTIYDDLSDSLKKEASWEITPQDNIADKNWLTPPAPFNVSSSTTSSTSSSAPLPPPTASAPSKSPTSSPSPLPASTVNSGTNAGAIAGGVVGGVAGLALIIAAVFFWMRRYRKRDVSPQQGPPPSGEQYTGAYNNAYNGAQHDRYAYEKAELDSHGVAAEADNDATHNKPAAYDPYRPSSDRPPVELGS